jgi:hypothetical protein
MKGISPKDAANAPASKAVVGGVDVRGTGPTTGPKELQGRAAEPQPVPASKAVVGGVDVRGTGPTTGPKELQGRAAEPPTSKAVVGGVDVRGTGPTTGPKELQGRSEIPWWEEAGGYASAEDAIGAGVTPPAGYEAPPPSIADVKTVRGSRGDAAAGAIAAVPPGAHKGPIKATGTADQAASAMAGEPAVSRKLPGETWSQAAKRIKAQQKGIEPTEAERRIAEYEKDPAAYRQTLNRKARQQEIDSAVKDSRGNTRAYPQYTGNQGYAQ